MGNALKGIRIGFALTGSFCTIKNALGQMEALKSECAALYPILSYHAAALDTRFMAAEELKQRLAEISGHDIIVSIPDAEPIGPQKNLDILLVMPCTGNTLAKIANGVIDTPVVMAVKSQLRNERPVVLGISTNDGLSGSAKNIGLLLNTRNIYFVPFSQDDPIQKPRSLQYCAPMTVPAVEEALRGRQIQPILH